LRQGKIRLDGEDVTRAPVRDLIRRGLYYLPSDRRGEGLILNRSARENIALANLFQPHLSARGWIKLAAEAELAADLSRRVDLRPPNLEKQVEQFSGGNQQKIMIAKALASKARVVIFDEPTVGVDVGTRAAIYAMMRDLCEAGVAILLISSDLPEILHLAHRAYVMYRGELRAELAGEEISQEGVLGHFFERGIND
jgi:ribose transport system ATP-binding protein